MTMMEIPVSEFELLTRSCRAWMDWSTTMEYALITNNANKGDLPFDKIKEWMRSMPGTSNLGILREEQA